MFHRQTPSLPTCSASLTSLHVSFPDAASLCYSFTVGRSLSGPWTQEVQGQLNKETFISCDNSNTCPAIGLLGNRLDTTKSWKTQVETLKNGVVLFKEQVFHMKQENNSIRGKFLNDPHIAGDVAQ